MSQLKIKTSVDNIFKGRDNLSFGKKIAKNNGQGVFLKLQEAQKLFSAKIRLSATTRNYQSVLSWGQK